MKSRFEARESGLSVRWLVGNDRPDSRPHEVSSRPVNPDLSAFCTCGNATTPGLKAARVPRAMGIPAGASGSALGGGFQTGANSQNSKRVVGWTVMAG